MRPDSKDASKSLGFAMKTWERAHKKKKEYKTAEELSLLPEVSGNYTKIVDAAKSIDDVIDRGDEQCKKVLDNHEKQFLLAYRVSLWKHG